MPYQWTLTGPMENAIGLKPGYWIIPARFYLLFIGKMAFGHFSDPGFVAARKRRDFCGLRSGHPTRWLSIRGSLAGYAAEVRFQVASFGDGGMQRVVRGLAAGLQDLYEAPAVTGRGLDRVHQVVGAEVVRARA